MYDNEKVLKASDQRDIVPGGGGGGVVPNMGYIGMCRCEGMLRLKCLLFEETLASPVLSANRPSNNCGL